jgi:D-glycero-D-manno-heptose 1,7-bisphosphate phosphatase
MAVTSKSPQRHILPQAAILVGGLGTRLGALTRETPKPMLPVGGRPFLSWLLDILRHWGAGEILLLAGYRAGAVLDVFADQPGVSVLIEPEPLGTGGALRHALHRLAPEFLLLNGDSVFDCDLQALAAADVADGAALALRSAPDAARYGSVDLDHGVVRRFFEGATGPGLINAGVAKIDRRVVAGLKDGSAISIEREVYPVLAAAGRLRGQVFEGDLIDIGTPDDFERAQQVVPAIAARTRRRARSTR